MLILSSVYLVLFVIFLFNIFYIVSIFSKTNLNLYYYFLVPTDTFLVLFLIIIASFSYYYSFFCFNVITTTSVSYQDFFYKLFVFWSTHEGSSLLWYFVFCIFGFCLVYLNNYLIKINFSFFYLFNVLKSFFYLYFLFFSNFFTINSNFFAEGYELNSVLQNPLMSIHPPVLYIGYLFAIILFVLNVYSFLSLSFLFHFFVFSKIVNYLSFVILLLGILLGSFWAYHELGWGGFWYWDPIENISLLPLLLLIISFHFYISRPLLLSSLYFLFLQLFYFLLSIFGTFFLRSGLISSVHSFILDYSRGFFLLIFYTLLLYFATYFFYIFIKSSFLFNLLSPFSYKKMIKLIPYELGLVLCTSLFYFFFVFWFTYYIFFVKLFNSIELYSFNYSFFASPTFVLLWFLLGICYFYFVFKSLIYPLCFFNVFCICFVVFFYLQSFYMLLMCCILICLFANMCNFNLVYATHVVFLILVLLVSSSQFYSNVILLPLMPGDLFALNGFNFLICPSINYENLYNSNLFCMFFKFIVFSSDFSQILGEISIDKSFLYESGNEKLKTEVLSNFWQDFHFIISSSTSFNSWILKIYIKPLFLFIWFFFFLFLFIILYFLLSNIYTFLRK